MAKPGVAEVSPPHIGASVDARRLPSADFYDPHVPKLLRCDGDRVAPALGDPLAPARGILLGCVIGAAIWMGGGVVIWLLF